MDRLLPYNSRRSVVVLALLLGMIAAVASRSSANADGMPQAADPELYGRQAYHLARHGEFRLPGPVEPELHRGPVANRSSGNPLVHRLASESNCLNRLSTVRAMVTPVPAVRRAARRARRPRLAAV